MTTEAILIRMAKQVLADIEQALADIPDEIKTNAIHRVQGQAHAQ
jgi:hypothetical protein